MTLFHSNRCPLNQIKLTCATARGQTWWGRNLTQAARVTLTKFVLFSQPVYVLTTLSNTKEVIQSVVWKRFLRSGNVNNFGGKCKVNWPTLSLPNGVRWGGPLDLEKFARALRSWWLWHERTAPEKTLCWFGHSMRYDETDKLLLTASTKVQIVNGAKISFAHSGWVAGRRSKDIVPDVFAISKRKA